MAQSVTRPILVTSGNNLVTRVKPMLTRLKPECYLLPDFSDSTVRACARPHAHEQLRNNLVTGNKSGIRL